MKYILVVLLGFMFGYFTHLIAFTLGQSDIRHNAKVVRMDMSKIQDRVVFFGTCFVDLSIWYCAVDKRE